MQVYTNHIKNEWLLCTWWNTIPVSLIYSLCKKLYFLTKFFFFVKKKRVKHIA